MEKKIHYKMHKVKKNWVAIGVTTLALIVAPKVLGLEAGLVHADDVKQFKNQLQLRIVAQGSQFKYKLTQLLSWKQKKQLLQTR